MIFEVQTPALKRVIDQMDGVMSGMSDGSMEASDAGRMVAAGRETTRAVSTELAVRLAMPKLAKAQRTTAKILAEDAANDARAA